MSSRKYPYIAFRPIEREPGDVILDIQKLGVKNNVGEYLFHDLFLRLNRGDKVAILSRNALSVSALFDVLSGEEEHFEGEFQYGQTIAFQYLPNDNGAYFTGDQDQNLID